MTSPNIVWLMADHLVYAHHKELTGYPQLPTFDRLAAEGTTFENAFSVCPLCGPARASMLTGVYPHRHGILRNEGDLGCRTDYEPDERLISHHLKEAGYRVGYFGKWHNGQVRTAQDYGFEGFSMTGYGHPYYADEYLAYLEEQGLPEPEVTLDWYFYDHEYQGKTISLKNDFPRPYGVPYPFMDSSGVINGPVETHEAFFLAHIANKWLEEAATGEEPFFLRFDPWGPHQPYYVAEPYANTVNPADLPEYPNFRNDLAHRPAHHRDLLDYRIGLGRSPNWEDWQPILARCHEHSTLVDAAIGQVVDRLEELSVLDNTLIIYTADHGGAVASNGGLVDKGWLMIDETVRIPMAIRWPNQVASGESTDKFVSNMDLVPTVLEAAGAILPTPIDGTSLLALSKQPSEATWRESLMLQHHGHYSKAHFQRQLRHGEYKYVAHLDDQDELYHITQDPYELENLIDQAHIDAILQEMRHRLVEQMSVHDDNAPDAKRLIAQMGLG